MQKDGKSTDKSPRPSLLSRLRSSGKKRLSTSSLETSSTERRSSVISTTSSLREPEVSEAPEIPSQETSRGPSPPPPPADPEPPVTPTPQQKPTVVSPKSVSAQPTKALFKMAVNSPARVLNGHSHSHQSSYSKLGASHNESQLGNLKRNQRVSSRFMSSSASTMVETVALLRRRCAEELGASVANTVVSSFENLVEWISTERLRRLPTEGSAWDKVLAWAQSFAEKFNDFDRAIEQFTGDNFDGAELAFGYCILLLQLGEDNASALQTSFGFFFKCSLDLIALLDRVELFNASNDITEQLVLSYADLVTLVSDVALRFYQEINSGKPHEIDIYFTFATTIDSFQSRRNKIVESMWKHQMVNENLDTDATAGIKTLRSWLATNDQILKHKAGDHTSLVNDRQQLTCLWFQSYLTRFLNSGKSSLTIAGPAGSGKTVLAGTIVDALQRATARRSYTVLFVPINGRIQAHATSLYVIRSLLSQFLEARVGNVQIYSALIQAYEKSLRSSSIEEYEQILWDALEKVISSTMPGTKETIIVVDGIDEVSPTPQVAQTLLKRLIDATSKHDNVRSITLSQPSSLPAKTHADVEITPDLVYDDIFAVISTLASKHPYLVKRSAIEKEILIDHVVSASQGSFLWAKLVIKRLLDESTPEQFVKACENIQKSPKPIHDVIREHITTANLGDDGKNLLTWLSIGQRPFTITELSSLLAVDPKTGTLRESPVNPLSALRPVTSLVFLQGDLVSLRHAVIRNAIVEFYDQPKQSPVERPAFNLVLRLLTHLKTTIKDQREPNFTPLTDNQTDKSFNQDPLTEYAVRYWTLHLAQVQPSNAELSPDVFTKLTPVFPSSPTVALLERACWTWQPTVTQVSWYKTAIECRRKVFKDDHPSILQSIIILASVFRNVHSPEQSTNYFYLASQLSIRIYSRTHPLTIQCLKSFLEVSNTLTTTTRTDIMTRREELLIILIESYKAQYGATSELVINTQTELVELYRSIKEEQKATQLYQSIHGTKAVDTETGDVRGTTGSLGVKIKGRKTKEIDYKEWDLNYQIDDVYVEATRSIEELLKLAQSYASQGQAARAEQTYLEAWSLITHRSRTNRSEEVESERISIALTIANFLKSQKRESEAGALVTGVWKEYEASSSLSRSEKVNTQIFQMGKFLQTTSLSAVALSVFKHCSEYMKSVNKTESSSYKEIQESLQASHQEVMKQASSSSSSATQLSESIMTEITQTMLSSKSTQLDVTSVTAVKSLLTAYVSQHRWKDATTIIKQALRVIWPTFFSSSPEDVGQPTSNTDFAIELVEQLLTCYASRRRMIKVQDYRERLFRSVKAVRKIDDTVVTHNIDALIKIYEWNKATDKIIQLWQELLVDYKKAFGTESPKTITTLFKLARLTSPAPTSIEYYRQIVTILTKDSKTCHKDALEPLITIADHYWNDRRYQDSTWAYTLLFRTFVQNGKELKQFQSPDYVSRVYQRLVGSLRETFTDISVIHQYTSEYRQTCIAVFGQSSKIAVEATITLARLCQSTKKYESEGIKLYEGLLQDGNAKEYHTEVRATLDAIHEEQALFAVRTASTSVSSEQASRAVTVIRQRMTKTRSEYGWAHEESLEQVKEMAYLYSRQQKKEEAVKELTETSRQIVSNESSSASLIKGASAVASAFVSCGESHRGVEMAEDLRWQLITGDDSNAKKYNMDLTKKKDSAAIYIAQLEYSLRSDTSTSFVDIYTTILTETSYYEEFKRSISTGQTVDVVFQSAARFYSFLTLHRRLTMLAHVEEQLVKFFISVSGDKGKVGDAAQVRILVVTMLQYFQTRQTKNFLQSVSYASIEKVQSLLKNGQQKQACDLAQTAFRYIKASNGYTAASSLKLGLALALAIADIEKNTGAQAGSVGQSQLKIAAEIIQTVLQSAAQLGLSLSHIPVLQLNNIIVIFGENKDYATLETILSALWNSREAQQTWRPSTVLALGQRLVLARYLCGKHDEALHLATDIAYNLRRVHGATNLATLDTNILLSQLCVSIGLTVQQRKGAEEIAKRYYKRAIGVHETVLRSLSVDPLGLNDEDDTTVLSVDPEPLEVSQVVDKDATQGTYARKHLNLLKLALERFGGYPKGYGEYEALNADIFRAYPEELNGVEGLEKWNIKGYGHGKAESKDGELNTNIRHWALHIPTAAQVNGTAA